MEQENMSKHVLLMAKAEEEGVEEQVEEIGHLLGRLGPAMRDFPEEHLPLLVEILENFAAWAVAAYPENTIGHAALVGAVRGLAEAVKVRTEKEAD